VRLVRHSSLIKASGEHSPVRAGIILRLSIDLTIAVDTAGLQAYRFRARSHTEHIPNLFGGIAVNYKRLVFLVAFAAGLLLFSSRAFAHHSTAEYDMTALTSVKGTVTQFEWSNPHAYIHITVKDDQGADTEWAGELASLGMLSRANWKRDTVKPGDVITMFGNRAKNGKPLMRLDKIVFANGQELSAQVR